MGRLNLYRNISITFIVFAAMILCAVFLSFYSQATIAITTDPQTVNLNFVTEIDVSSDDIDVSKQDVIGGTLTIATTSVSVAFNTSSTRSSSASNLVGSVKLINNNSKSQRLVRTTQLQANNGVIVRTDNDVDIPAGASVMVPVFPKDPASFQQISDGRLVIIKLWPQLQDKIYGEVVSPLVINTGGEVFYIAESDLSRAKKELVEIAIASYNDSDLTAGSNIKGELVSYEIDKKLGDEAKTFTMTAVIKLSVYQANEAQLAQLIKRKAQKMDLNGLSADSIDLSQVKFTVLDASKDNIVIKVSYPLKAYLTENNEILNKNNFTDKTASEIKSWAAQTGVIKNTEVIISPYWRDKTPKNPKRIKLIINN